ncbi:MULTISPECIES: PIN domain-containing protein [Acinetobacter]|uniref:PIN domain-containing protein n=1 Tax=Acinetobacter corruptisaponis TaxID=3045147 RepID=A0ABY8S9P8_9GAMM|nr:PIN domain-containing protein [Acinetobacter sp. KCTC 92772]WHP07463.1 PIN domain-containing protein [Acinetobacter sp. KCTC 92772]
MKKVLLLDIENIHKTEKELLHLLKTYACVYLVYAKSPVTLSLDALIKFSPFVVEKKLVVIKMPKIGKDAADFGLAFLAGQLSIQMDKTATCFDVMSNDGALEYIVDLLKIMGFQSTQIKTLIEQPKETLKSDLNEEISTIIPDITQFSQRPHLMIFKKFCEYLAKIPTNKPTKIESLKNTIRTKVQVEHIDENLIFSLLLNYKIIQKDELKVIYIENNLHTWANLILPEDIGREPQKEKIVQLDNVVKEKSTLPELLQRRQALQQKHEYTFTEKPTLTELLRRHDPRFKQAL